MRKLLFCLCFLCFPWLWLRAQQRIAFARLPPFERAVVCVKFFEGFHGRAVIRMWVMGINFKRGSIFLRICPSGKRTLCSALTLWRNSTASRAMAKMLCSFLFWLIMSALGAFLAMASSQRANFCAK